MEEDEEFYFWGGYPPFMASEFQAAINGFSSALEDSSSSVEDEELRRLEMLADLPAIEDDMRHPPIPHK